MFIKMIYAAKYRQIILELEIADAEFLNINMLPETQMQKKKHEFNNKCYRKMAYCRTF